jgi:hypothetical protein
VSKKTPPRPPAAIPFSSTAIGRRRGKWKWGSSGRVTNYKIDETDVKDRRLM